MVGPSPDWAKAMRRFLTPESAFNQRRSVNHDREEGSSLVEFALIAPLIMVIVTGLFFCGMAVNNYMILTSAVSSGARALSLTRDQTTPALAASDPCAYAAQIANQAALGLNTSAISYSVIWTPAGASSTTYSSVSSSSGCAGAAFGQGDTVQLNAVYTVPIAVYGWSRRSASLTARTAELVQ
jgi:Flp pilus assembly protein TadG